MSASVLPGSLRGETPVRGFAIVGFAALASAAVAAYISDARPPALGEIVLGVLPQVILVVSTVAFAAMRFLRERLRIALDLGIEAALIGLLVGALSSASGIWTDGTAESAMTVSDAVSFFLTGGVFPMSTGPSAAVRFLPIVSLLVVLMYARRRVTVPKLIPAAVLAYVLPAVALLSTTATGLVSAMIHGTLASDSSTIFKTLVTAHADGYWTTAQAERFLLPAARQAENALLGFRGAVALIFSGMLIVGSALGESALAKLVKRLRAPESLRIFVIALCGLALGLASAAMSTSHATAFSLILGLFVLIAWIAAVRFQCDLVELPRHEREHPDYPLPSGAIQSQDLEIIIVSLFAFSLGGSIVLGYPVFVALLAATLCARLSEERTPKSSFWMAVLFSGVTLLTLAHAGGLIGSRLLAVPGWIGRIFLALALVQAVGMLFRRYALDLESRIAGVAIVLLALIGVGILANQLVFWASAGVGIGILIFSARSPGRWHRVGPWAFDAIVGLVALLSLVVPQFFRRF